MTFAERFKQLKEKAGLTLDDLAGYAGYLPGNSSRQFMSNVCRGRSYLPPQALKNICANTGWPYASLATMICLEKYEKTKQDWGLA